MSTKITNKQVKIISNVDFNEKEIENAIIDAEKNEITNLDIPTKVSDLENDSGYTTVADVNSEIIANSPFMDNELKEGSFNAVTNDAITKGIEKNKVSVVDNIVNTLPTGTLTLGQNVLNTTDNKIYKTVYEPELTSALNVIGNLTINADSTINGFSEDNYLYSIDGEGSGVGGSWTGFTIEKLMFELSGSSYSGTATIFSILRRDDGSVLFGIDFFNRGYGGIGTLTFYTKKRDGTIVDSATISVGYGVVYEFTQTSSNYIELRSLGRTILIKYFDSLNASDDIEDDFYYGIAANIKISSVRVISGANVYTIGISKLYGSKSYIKYVYQGPPSSFYITYTYSSNPVIWDLGTDVEKGKIIYNVTDHLLYEYNGSELFPVTSNMDLYQKKLTAGNNITISGEGYFGFSNTNYLSFNSSVTSSYTQDLYFKVRLNEINSNNTLFYSSFDTNQFGVIEITSEGKLNCVWSYNGSSLSFIGANYVFEANKTYWIRLIQSREPQQFYILEDNGYTINTLPQDRTLWTSDAYNTSYDLVVKINAGSTNYLGYNPTYTSDYFKGSIEEFSVKDIITLSTAKEGIDFTNHGCLKGPIISAIVPEIDSQLSDTSENPVQNKVIDAALKAMKPVIVTDSGTTLPSASGYQLNDTFLNTTDKKIYTSEMGGYQLNTNVTSTVTVDLTTGVATGFGANKNIYRTSSNFLWSGNAELRVHFKQTYMGNPRYIVFLSMTSNGTNGRYACVCIYRKKLYFSLLDYDGQQDIITPYTETEITTISTNIEYYLKVTKTGTSGRADLYTEGYDSTPIISVDFVTEDYIMSGATSSTLQFGGNSSSYLYQNDYLNAYLLDSTGEFLVSSGLIWDSGTSILNSTGYIDKANGILHYYESPDLISIGGGSGALTKKVYTISADNITTLDVSSDFTTIVDVLKNGIEIYENDDYTISGGIITFITPLSIADKICVKGEE